ncbi:hypothetical protein B0H16DRAFT_691213 [Mycena metata]|uniref:Uncharacterized protein n=1 Tax=Mycena metata TaxID=1033252 RepID=A0AAD7GV21_9AGAR|nr:hypothetical protein B0H16DRAFT_691213 [Mycena metata]
MSVGMGMATRMQTPARVRVGRVRVRARRVKIMRCWSARGGWDVAPDVSYTTSSSSYVARASSSARRVLVRLRRMWMWTSLEMVMQHLRGSTPRARTRGGAAGAGGGLPDKDAQTVEGRRCGRYPGDSGCGSPVDCDADADASAAGAGQG